MSIYQKELLALILVVSKWRHYLLEVHFIIKIDHDNLKYLREQKITIVLQQKWLAKPIGLDYEFQYKKRKENVVVDTLSKEKILEDHTGIVQCNLSLTPNLHGYLE